MYFSKRFLLHHDINPRLYFSGNTLLDESHPIEEDDHGYLKVNNKQTNIEEDDNGYLKVNVGVKKQQQDENEKRNYDDVDVTAL